MDPNGFGSRFVAVRHRPMSPSVYFGPFDSLDDLRDFADAHDISVGVIELIDPAQSSPEDWWG